MKAWTEEQYQKANRQQLERHLQTIRNERDAREELFAHENQAYAGWKAFQATMDSGKLSTRWLIGADMKARGLLGIADPHWSSQDARDFRYNTLPLFQGYATYVHFVLENLAHPDSPTDPVKSAMHASTAAIQRTAEEYRKDFPWAKANSDKVEEISLNTLDPYLFAGWITDGIKAAGAAAEIKQLVPHAQNVVDAMNENRSVVLATKALWGADSGSPSFIRSMRDMISNNAPVEHIAAWMHTVGFRSPEWAVTNPLPGSEWFKRGWNLYSPRLKEIAQDLTWMKAAIMEEKAVALSNVPDITEAELPIVQEILSKVPRDSHDPVGSFTANYLKASMEGRLPDGTALHVPFVKPETFEKLKLLVHDLSAGWRDSAWIPAYAPSKNDEEFLEAGVGKATRIWQMKRVNYEPFDKVDEFRRAVATVKTRVFKADTIDALDRMVDLRVHQIDEAVQELYAGIDKGYLDGLKSKAAALRQQIPKGTFETTPLRMDVPHGSADQSYIESLKAMGQRLAKRTMRPGLAPLEVGSSEEAIAVGRAHVTGRIAAFEEEAAGWKQALAGADKAGRAQIESEIERVNSILAFEREKLAALPAPKTPISVPRAELEGRLSATEQALREAESQSFTMPGRWESRLKSMPKDVRRLITEREVLLNMTKDLKEMKDSPDLFKWAADLDPTGISRVLLDSYDRVLRTVKMAAVRPNPFVWWHQLTDIGGLRPWIETGKNPIPVVLKAMKEGKAAPSLDYAGNALDFGHSPVELLYGKERRAGTAFQKANKFIDSRFEALHSAAYNMVGSHHYEMEFGKQLKLGLKPEQAHNYAMRHAREVLDVMHGTYDNITSAGRVLSRFFPFSGHYVQRASYWGTKAVEHPTAAYALVRARELQQDLSVDRQGALRVPYTNFAIDPGRRLTGFQVMDSAIETDKLLNAQEPERFKLYRGLQAITGSPYPHVDLALQAAGVAPISEPRPINDWETAVNFASNAMTKGDVMPSDPLFHFFGKNPDEDRLSRTGRVASMQKIAADKRGEKISGDEAWDRAQHYQNVNKLGSYFGLVYDSNPEMKEVRDAHYDFRDTMLKTPPELRGAMRLVLSEEYEKKFPGISSTFILDPAARQGAMTHKLDLEESRTKAELMQKREDAAEIIGHSWLGNILEKAYNILVPPAGAAEFDDKKLEQRLARARALVPAQDGGTQPLPPAHTFTVGSYGVPVAVSDGTTNSRLQSAKATAEISTHLTALKATSSIKEAHEYIKEKAATSPTLINNLRFLSDKDNTAKAAIDAYDYVENKGGQIRGQFLPATRANIDGISQTFSNFVANSGYEAEKWIKMSPDQVRKAVASGVIPKPVGVTDKAYDDYAIISAQQKAANMVGIAHRNAADMTKRQYPETSYAIEQLKDAANRPDRIAPVVESVNKRIENGALKKSFWNDLATDKNTAEIHDRVAIASADPEIRQVTQAVGLTNTQGHVVGVSASVVNRLYQDGFGHYIDAMREGYGDQKIGQAINSLPHLPPVDHDATVKAFRSEFRIASGEGLPDILNHAGTPAKIDAAAEQGTQNVLRPPLVTALGHAAISVLDFGPARIPDFTSKTDFANYTRGLQLPQLRNTQYHTMGEWVADSARDAARINAGITDPAKRISVPEVMGAKATRVDETGKPVGSTLSPQIAASAALSVYQVAQAFGATPADPEAPINRSASGLSTALSTFSSLSSIGVPPNVAAPVAGVTGILKGIGAFGGKSDRTQEFEDIAKARAAAQAEREAAYARHQAEVQAAQDARDLTQRAQTLSRSLVDNPAIASRVSRETAQHQLNYQRRPTFAYKQGLVDAVERSVANQLRPTL